MTDDTSPLDIDVASLQVPDGDVLTAVDSDAPDTDLALMRAAQSEGDFDQLAYAAPPTDAGDQLLDVTLDTSQISALISVPGVTGSALVMAKNAVAWASKQVGRKETPPYSNIIFAWADVKPAWQGEPWCAAFVTDAWARQGVDLRRLMSNPFYCPYLESWAKSLGVWQPARKGWDPRVGDISIMGRNLATHTGLAAPAAGSYSGYRQIEGNTSSSNSGSQTNGDGCYVRIRPDNGFIRGWINMQAAIPRLQAAGKLGKPSSSSKPSTPSTPAKPRPNVDFSVTMQYVTGSKRGQKNGNVAIMQRALHAQSVSAACPLSSKWDNGTKAAYAKYQSALGYRGSDADGVPGWDSWSRLMKWAGYTPVK